jgi:tRNA threonylcarbamoyladenosine modification (KEOPS) complex  Pcc1 subunit
MPEAKTTITIDYRDQKTALAIQKSVTPDNLELPDGTHIFMAVVDNTLEIEILSERSIGSLVATLDDLLSCIQAGEKALEEA